MKVRLILHILMNNQWCLRMKLGAWGGTSCAKRLSQVSEIGHDRKEMVLTTATWNCFSSVGLFRVLESIINFPSLGTKTYGKLMKRTQS